MVGQPAAARTAWIDAVGHAGALDEHLVLLVAAAELAGVLVDADELLLPLVIRNADNLHRRKSWTAFTSANPLRRRSIGYPSGRSRTVDPAAMRTLGGAGRAGRYGRRRQHR